LGDAKFLILPKSKRNCPNPNHFCPNFAQIYSNFAQKISPGGAAASLAPMALF